MQLQYPLRPRTAALALLVAGTLTAGLVSATTSTAHAASGLHYQRGYSVQGSWLCYGWSNGAYHCTQHWTRSSGRLISENPAWVPNYGVTSHVTTSMAKVAKTATTSVAKKTTTTSVTTYTAGFYAATPRNLSQWAWTGHSAYPQPRGNYQGYSWGWCTSGAAMLAHDNVSRLGNAAAWTRNAAARGLPTGYTPRAGATVVFQPGVQGASSGGHVGHVVAIYRNGWFLVAETAFWWNGGGFGRVSYRYAHAGAGVSFIY